jgi:Hypothetical protein FLILHELTA
MYIIVPKLFSRYANLLRNQPISHISAFLLLHEITAITPIFGLAYLFHITQWTPPLIGGSGEWVAEGAEKFGGYMRKKGWVGEEGKTKMGEGGIRIIFELGVAYAVTKAFLPARLALSFYATPWFARTIVVPLGGVFRKIFGKVFKKGGKGGVTKIAGAEKGGVPTAAGTGPTTKSTTVAAPENKPKL